MAKHNLKTGKKKVEATRLHIAEIGSYFVIWISAVLYSIYRVYSIGKYFQHDKHSEDFTSGWLWRGKKDVSDYEWNLWLPAFVQLVPWFIVHLVGAELCRWYNVKLVPAWYILLSSIYLWHIFGVMPIMVLLLQPVLFALIASTVPYKSVTWITSLVELYFFNVQTYDPWLNLPYELSFLLTLAQSWMYLRCLSYCLDVQDGRASPSLYHLLAYCLYLPVLLLGPVILYSDFKESMDKTYSPWTLSRFLTFLFGIARYTFWVFLMELWLHLIYSNALAYQSDVVYTLDAWTLYGLGYCLGQYFMMKYTVVYGMPGVFARAEGVPAPSPPKCIGRIHLYSEMWRTFDQGLYFFLSRYIYTPVARDKSKMSLRILASLLCFSFVYVWHGTMLYILIWSALNFLGVTTEAAARRVASHPTFTSWQSRWMGARGKRRFHALLASPLLFMSALSNFYFFAGLHTGNVFMERAIGGIWSSSLVVTAFLYCCCHVSMEVQDWEQATLQDKPKNCLE